MPNLWDLLILNPMTNTLLWIYSFIGNFGIAIILFTILIRLVTYPLNTQQMKSSQAMQEFQNSKEWQEIQKKYKDDRQKLALEQQRVMREMGVNPLSGCLPTLIQFPIIIGLYQAITRALAVSPLQLLGLSDLIYPFIPISTLIPINNNFLWMDLSQPERLMIFGVGIPVMAIIVVATTWVQSKLMTPPSTTKDQGAQMAQSMTVTMPLVIGFMALNFASGLSLYFITSNVVTIAQYAIQGKADWKSLLPSSIKKTPASKAPIKSSKK